MSQSLKRSSPLPASHSRALFGDLRLQPAGRAEPLLEECHALRVGEPEEEVFGSFQHRRAPVRAE